MSLSDHEISELLVDDDSDASTDSFKRRISTASISSTPGRGKRPSAFTKTEDSVPEKLEYGAERGIIPCNKSISSGNGIQSPLLSPVTPLLGEEKRQKQMCSPCEQCLLM